MTEIIDYYVAEANEKKGDSTFSYGEASCSNAYFQQRINDEFPWLEGPDKNQIVFFIEQDTYMRSELWSHNAYIKKIQDIIVNADGSVDISVEDVRGGTFTNDLEQAIKDMMENTDYQTTKIN